MVKKFKCSKCNRMFGMAAHLGRHMLSHASPQKKAATKRKRAAATKGVTKKARVGRPKAAASKAGLRGMSINALTQLISDARTELRGRITELEKALK